MTRRPQKLLDAVRETIRLKHYSPRTEQAYLYWIKRYVLFHNKRHPREVGVSEIEAFLTHLAVDEQVAASNPTVQPGPVLKLPCFRAENEFQRQDYLKRANNGFLLPTLGAGCS